MASLHSFFQERLPPYLKPATFPAQTLANSGPGPLGGKRAGKPPPPAAGVSAPPPSRPPGEGQAGTVAPSSTRPNPEAIFSCILVNKTNFRLLKKKKTVLTQCQTRTETRSSPQPIQDAACPAAPGPPPRDPAPRPRAARPQRAGDAGRSGLRLLLRPRAGGRGPGRPGHRRTLTSLQARGGGSGGRSSGPSPGGRGAVPRAAARALLSGRRPPRRLLGHCRRLPRRAGGPRAGSASAAPAPASAPGLPGLGALVGAVLHTAAVAARSEPPERGGPGPQGRPAGRSGAVRTACAAWRPVRLRGGGGGAARSPGCAGPSPAASPPRGRRLPPDPGRSGELPWLSLPARAAGRRGTAETRPGPDSEVCTEVSPPPPPQPAYGQRLQVKSNSDRCASSPLGGENGGALTAPSTRPPPPRAQPPVRSKDRGSGRAVGGAASGTRPGCTRSRTEGGGESGGHRPAPPEDAAGPRGTVGGQGPTQDRDSLGMCSALRRPFHYFPWKALLTNSPYRGISHPEEYKHIGIARPLLLIFFLSHLKVSFCLATKSCNDKRLSFVLSKWPHLKL